MIQPSDARRVVMMTIEADDVEDAIAAVVAACDEALEADADSMSIVRFRDMKDGTFSAGVTGPDHLVARMALWLAPTPADARDATADTVGAAVQVASSAHA